MTLSPEAQAAIAAEEKCLEEVLTELRAQQTSGERRFSHEADRARDLSSQIVASRRDVEKQMLASDEAVAHGLTKLKKEELEGIEKLLERPYFARIVLEENEGAHKRKIEFRLGHTGNLECRIIDWRKAPLAKLFYEYREGDEYFEEIQGRERTGRVLLRNKVGIEHGELRTFSCHLGSFEKTEQGWVEKSLRARSGSADSYGQLPTVLSLITPEQYQTITGDTERAVLIQGVAGSGKTTVAIHRLAYLLGEGNSKLNRHDAAVVVLSPGLQVYIRKSAEALGVDVPVLSYTDWVAPTAAAALKYSSVQELNAKRTRQPAPPGAARVFRSLALLRAVEAASAREPETVSEREILWRVLGRVHEVLDLDETKLLDRDIVLAAKKHLDTLMASDQFDPLEEPLLARLYEIRKKSFARPSGEKALYGHLVVDEVQDFYPAELASLIGAVKEIHQLTLVGDTSQASRDRSPFPVWEKLRKFWSLGESLSSFLNLSVSHRSTLPIMRLAQHVQGTSAHMEGRPGKPPLWFSCDTEDQAVTEAIHWLERVAERFPNSVTAVVCRSDAEAKYVQSLLEPSFGPTLSRAENGKLDFQEGIIVTPVDYVKGLEFPHVLIWNPSAHNYPEKEQSRNLLYIAITRAEEHLCLISHGRPSPLLPSIDSRLVRGIRQEHEPEEKESDDWQK